MISLIQYIEGHFPAFAGSTFFDDFKRDHMSYYPLYSQFILIPTSNTSLLFPPLIHQPVNKLNSLKIPNFVQIVRSENDRKSSPALPLGPLSILAEQIHEIIAEIVFQKQNSYV